MTQTGFILRKNIIFFTGSCIQMKESVTKVSILPACLCFFFNTLNHLSVSHQHICDVVITFCPHLSMSGITKVQKNTAPP